VDPINEKEFASFREKFGLASLSIPSATLDPRAFTRTLAKIGHAFGVAELGVKGFTPFLLPLILDVPGSNTYYVGGFDPQIPQSESELIIRGERLNEATILVVEISLHFFRRLPRYQVVIGQAAARLSEA